MKSRTSLVAKIILSVSLTLLSCPQSGWAQVKLQQTLWPPSIPEDNSPNAKNDELTVRLQFVDPNNNKQVTSADITIKVDKWDGKKETFYQAQLLKAVAIR